MSKYFISAINLHLFDGASAGGDGGAMGSNGADSQAQNMTGNDPVISQQGTDGESPQKSLEERRAEFEKLITGEYKDLYNGKVQDTIQKRLRNAKGAEEQVKSMQPIMDLLYSRYGVDSGNLKGIQDALMNDNAYWENAADDAGMTVEQFKQYTQMQNENKRLREAQIAYEARERANADMARWSEQANELQMEYPEFDLRTEIQDERFVRMLNMDVDMKAAYEAMHPDIARQSMSMRLQQQMSNGKKARNARPVENGISSNGASTFETDVSKLTKAQRKEIASRAMRGEKITF